MKAPFLQCFLMSLIITLISAYLRLPIGLLVAFIWIVIGCILLKKHLDNEGRGIIITSKYLLKTKPNNSVKNNKPQLNYQTTFNYKPYLKSNFLQRRNVAVNRGK